MSSQTLTPPGGSPPAQETHTAKARGRVLPFPITGRRSC